LLTIIRCSLTTTGVCFVKIEKNANNTVTVNAKVLGSIVDDMIAAYRIVVQTNKFVADELRESALLLALYAEMRARVENEELVKLATTKTPLQ
jgi:hypothetical protein